MNLSFGTPWWILCQKLKSVGLASCSLAGIQKCWSLLVVNHSRFRMLRVIISAASTPSNFEDSLNVGYQPKSRSLRQASWFLASTLKLILSKLLTWAEFGQHCQHPTPSPSLLYWASAIVVCITHHHYHYRHRSSSPQSSESIMTSSSYWWSRHHHLISIS